MTPQSVEQPQAVPPLLGKRRLEGIGLPSPQDEYQARRQAVGMDVAGDAHRLRHPDQNRRRPSASCRLGRSNTHARYTGRAFGKGDRRFHRTPSEKSGQCEDWQPSHRGRSDTSASCSSHWCVHDLRRSPTQSRTEYDHDLGSETSTRCRCYELTQLTAVNWRAHQELRQPQVLLRF